MHTQFISMAYKQHNVMPLTKTLSKAVYSIPVVLQERVKKLASGFGYPCQVSENVLTVNFND